MTSSMSFIRVQDAEGRGPYRPGFSARWVDDDHDSRNPSFMDEFGWDLLARERRKGEHYGSALRGTRGLHRWFSVAELDRLRLLGYQVVRIKADRVLAESDAQAVIARRKPLRFPDEVIPWEQAMKVTDGPVSVR